MPPAALTALSLASDGGGSWVVIMGPLALAVLIVGLAALAFVILCTVVMTALVFGLWLARATWGVAKRRLVPQVKRAIGRGVLRSPHARAG